MMWAADFGTNRAIYKAYGAVKNTFQGICERKAFGSWLLETKRRIYVRNTGERLKSRKQLNSIARMRADGLSAFEESITRRKFHKLHSFDDVIDNYQYRVANVIRNICVKRAVVKQLKGWIDYWRHGPSSQLYVPKLEPGCTFTEIRLTFPAQLSFQETLQIRTVLRDECLLALRHAHRLSNTSYDALDEAIQILDLDVAKQTAIVKIRRVDRLGSPVSLANQMVRALCQRTATITYEGVWCRVDGAHVRQSQLIKLPRWWCIRGRNLLRQWSTLVVTIRSARHQQAVCNRKSMARRSRRSLALWALQAQQTVLKRKRLLTALMRSLHRFLLRYFPRFYHQCQACRVATQRYKKANTLGAAILLRSALSVWVCFCTNRRGQEGNARAIVKEWSSAQMRGQCQMLEGWRQYARRRAVLRMAVDQMSDRVLVRLDTTTNRRALFAWRAHTQGTLRGRRKNLGMAHILHAVHVNKMMIVDRFVLQSVRFLFIRWAMCRIEARPFARLLASQRKRQRTRLHNLAFDLWRDRLALHCFHDRAILTHDLHKQSRRLFSTIRHWGLTTKYAMKVATFFIVEFYLWRLGRLVAYWRHHVRCQSRLRVFIVRYHRRLSARILQAWKALLTCQDRVGSILAARLHAHINTLAKRVLQRWHLEALYMYRMRILTINFINRVRRQRCIAVARAWRNSVQRTYHVHAVFLHMRTRHRLSTLRCILEQLRTLRRYPPIVRRSIAVVVGHMDASRHRILAASVLRSWRVRCRCARKLVTAGGRLVTLLQVLYMWLCSFVRGFAVLCVSLCVWLCGYVGAWLCGYV